MTDTSIFQNTLEWTEPGRQLRAHRLSSTDGWDVYELRDGSYVHVARVSGHHRTPTAISGALDSIMEWLDNGG